MESKSTLTTIVSSSSGLLERICTRRLRGLHVMGEVSHLVSRIKFFIVFSKGIISNPAQMMHLIYFELPKVETFLMSMNFLIYSKT